MGVSDTAVVIALGIIFNYLVVYRKSKFFGGIGYLAISLATMSFIGTDVGKAVGLIMLLGSIVLIFMDIISKK